jgi:alpha-D-ribose 1-methylphosphonate 5-triphosphate diphosphatase
LNIGEVSEIRNKNLTIKSSNIVTPQGLIEGVIEVEKNRIVRISHDNKEAVDIDLDTVRNNIVMPGFVDIHSDNFEIRISPRNNVFLPTETGVLQSDFDSLINGITTKFYAITFDNREYTEKLSKLSPLIVNYILTHSKDFYTNAYINARCELSVENCAQEIVTLANKPRTRVKIISYNIHIPGFGAYTVDKAIRFLKQRFGFTEAECMEFIAKEQRRTEYFEPNIKCILDGYDPLSQVLASHDNYSIEDAKYFIAKGSTIFEFPVTNEVAQYAIRNGIDICVSAPNIVLGKSMYGNLSAREILSKKLTPIISSDYAPSTLLDAAYFLRESLGVSFPALSNLLSWLPSRATKLERKGRLEEGFEADLICIEWKNNPTLVLSIVDGEVKYISPRIKKCAL